MVAKNSGAAGGNEVKRKRTRSPLNPGLDLKEAVRRARQFYDNEHKHPAAPEAVAEHWGIKPTSSSLPLYISALRQFGLLEDVTEFGKSRMLKLTPLALDILLNEEESPEQLQAIKAAALQPKLHAELWQMYGGRLPASDTSIRVYLLRHMSFNPGAVDDFIQQFRNTVAFANLTEDDKIQPEREGDVPGAIAEQGAVAKPTTAWVNEPFGVKPPAPSVGRHPMQAAFKEDVFTLDEGQVVLQWPEKMSQNSFEDFESWLQLVIRKVKRSIRSDGGESAQNE